MIDITNLQIDIRQRDTLHGLNVVTEFEYVVSFACNGRSLMAIGWKPSPTQAYNAAVAFLTEMVKTV